MRDFRKKEVNDMPLDRVGLGVSKRSEESKNKEKRTGRSDGGDGGQPTVGHLSEESATPKNRKGRFSGNERVGTKDLAQNPFTEDDLTKVPGATGTRLGAQGIDAEKKED
jgi:hypothetical protein